MFLRRRLSLCKPLCFSLVFGAFLAAFLTAPQNAFAQVYNYGCVKYSNNSKPNSFDWKTRKDAHYFGIERTAGRDCNILPKRNYGYDGGLDHSDRSEFVQEYTPHKTINRSSSFWQRNRGYYQPEYQKKEWHEGLTNEEVRAKTIWSGADKNDRKMQAEVLEKQLRDSPEAPETIRQAWTAAQYFLAEQKPTLAEPLLKELVVTIESHKMTNENSKILAEAKNKLSKLEAIKERISDTHPRRNIAVRRRDSFSIGFRQY